MKTFKMNRIYLAISIMFFVVSTFSLQAKTIYYVTTTGTGDGSSWSNAASNIQTMIDKAISGDEIWVAKGTYYPTTETIPRDARSCTFMLKNGVGLYGGFAGTETAISQRALIDLDNDSKIEPWEFVNSTILSGNIDGKEDVWTKTLNSDGKTWKWIVTGNEANCYTIVTADLTFNSITIFNGFSVNNGNANITGNDIGGGILSGNNTLIQNCMVNYCLAIKGGVVNLSSNSSTSNSSSSVTNSIVFNCSAPRGISSTSTSSNSSYTSSFPIINCNVNNCDGIGIYSSSSSSNSFATSKPSSSASVSNCIVYNCSGNGIYSASNSTNSSTNNFYSSSSSSSSSVSNCLVFNCYGTNGGGICSSSFSSNSSSSSSTSTSSINNCTVYNCTASLNGGGIYSSSQSYSTYSTYNSSSSKSTSSSTVMDCAVFNSVAFGKGGGIFSTSSSFSNVNSSSYSSSLNTVTNSAASNNKLGTSFSNFEGGISAGNITPDINITFINPSSFIGIANNAVQETELLTSDFNLREGSPCINPIYGNGDIGVYSYIMPKVLIPSFEYFDNSTDLTKSNLFYHSSKLNTRNDILWTIVNQKADFNWQTNLTSTYSQPIFTYQIDGTKTSKIYLRYDMYFQAYAGTISPLGTEKLNVEFSKDLVTWSTIATYSNANGTIANQTYKYDISTLAAGKTFFIRFNANGQNSNRIEKWEIDNVVIDADGVSAVELTKADKLLYSISDSKLTLRNIEQGSYVQLFDINGKLIDSAKANSNTLDFILPVHGVYILKASSESGITSRKVVL